MRSLGFYFGTNKRNDPIKLVDPRPIHNYGDDVCTGDAGRDGFTLLSRAQPDQQGNPPPVKGQIGPAFRSPSQDFEQ